MENHETLFSIDTGKRMWYLDYDRENDVYYVCRDEFVRGWYNTMGEALEFIFNTLGGTHLQLVNLKQLQP